MINLIDEIINVTRDTLHVIVRGERAPTILRSCSPTPPCARSRPAFDSISSRPALSKPRRRWSKRRAPGRRVLQAQARAGQAAAQRAWAASSHAATLGAAAAAQKSSRGCEQREQPPASDGVV